MGYWDKGERQLSPAVETLVERIFLITCWRTFCVNRSRLKSILSFSLGWSNTIKFLLLLWGNLSQLENQSRFDAKSWRHTMCKSRWVQWSLNKGINKKGAWQHQKPSDVMMLHQNSDVSGIASEDDERNVYYIVLNGQIPDMLTMAGIGVGDPWSLPFSIITASGSEIWRSKHVTEFFLSWFLFCRRQALIQRELCNFLLTFSSTWTIYAVSICFYSKRKEKLKRRILT